MSNYEQINDVSFGASAIAQSGFSIGGWVRSTLFEFEVVRNGELIWSVQFPNLVVDAGINDALDKQFKASSYTAAWYVGLISTNPPTIAAADIMSSHPGWTELTGYDESSRQTLVLGSISGKSVNNNASRAEYTITSNSTTIGGAFITTSSTKGGTTGILYGAGTLSPVKTLDAGDVLKVGITLSGAAA